MTETLTPSDTVARQSRTAGPGVPRLFRAATGVALLLYAVMSGVFSMTLGSVASALAFLAAQLFLAVGVVGLARVTVSRAPVLTTVTVALLLVSAFGHAAASGVELIVAVAPGGSAAADALFASGPGLAIIMTTMITLVVGTVLLGITAARSVPGTWWIALTLAAWVAVEFGASSLGVWSSVTASALLLASFGGLAMVVRRSAIALWAAPVD